MDQLNYHFHKFLQCFKEELTADVVSSIMDALKHAQNSYPKEIEDEFLTVKEVCARFQISKSQVHNLRKKYKKEFPIIRIGNSVRFKQIELETFFKNLKNKK